MPAILSRVSILFINVLRDLDNTKILLYKFFVLHLVVKLACKKRDIFSGKLESF